MSRRPLRILYNASAVPVQRAGAGVYALELGAALAARPSLKLSVLSPRDAGFGDHVRTPAKRVARLLWEEARLASAPELRDADIYHGTHFFTPRSKTTAVATVHDLTFFRIPRRYSRARRTHYRRLARTATRAARLIVPSAAVAADCVRFLGYPPENVRVIAEAPRAGLEPASASEVAAFRREYGIEGPYLACLGTAEPGKRAVDAIRAMPAILERRPGTTLVLVGNPGPLSGALEREVARLSLPGAVRFLGYLPDRALPAFLTGAMALIFPSLYEGFGLPPLEALACGTPVIATDAPAMSEILAGGTLFVPMRDPAAIAGAALSLFEGDRRETLAFAGAEFVRRFTWARAAAETEAVYRELVP